VGYIQGAAGRLSRFTTGVDRFFANYDAFVGRLAEAGCLVGSPGRPLQR
jgi:hypothetical protein